MVIPVPIIMCEDVVLVMLSMAEVLLYSGQ